PDKAMNFSYRTKAHPNFEYDRIMRELELKSIIDHRNASDRAYDGETTTVLLQDEIGKIMKKGGNVKRRVNVVRHCVQRGGDKRGILFGFTTVGNMEREGGMEFKEVFNDADQNNRNELGYTKNGFVNYFVSALEATVFDEWGNPVID